MRTILLAIVFLASVLTFQLNQPLPNNLNPNNHFEIPINVTEILLSPDGNILAAYNKTVLNLYEAYNGSLLESIVLEAQIIGIDFSQDSTWIGIVATNTEMYKWQLKKFHGQYSIQQVSHKVLRETQDDDDFYALGCCFVFGNHFVIMWSDGMLQSFGPDNFNIPPVGFFNKTDSAKIACSPHQSLKPEFVIAQFSNTENETTLKLSFFNISYQSLQIIEANPYYIDSISDINYITIDNIYQYIYLIVNNNSVIRFEIATGKYSNFYTGVGQLYKISVPYEKVFAVVNKTHVTYNTSINQPNLNKGIQQYYNTTYKTFALSLTNLFFISQNGSANNYGVCPNQQFFIGDRCLKCNIGCQTCSDTPDACHSCIETFILKNKTCSCPQTFKMINNKCVCTDGHQEVDKKCVCPSGFQEVDKKCICPSGFQEVNKTCICPQGYSEVDKKCVEEGTKVWIIALSVGGGALILIIITGVTCYLVRKRKKQEQQKQLIAQQAKQNY